MKRDVRVYIEDILEAIAKIEEYMGGLKSGVNLKRVLKVAKEDILDFKTQTLKIKKNLA